MNRPSSSAFANGPAAVDVEVDGADLVVTLSNGQRVYNKLSQFPRLAAATEDELANWRLIGKGVGVHWPDLDEDLSVAGLVRDGRTALTRPASEPASANMLESASSARSQRLTWATFLSRNMSDVSARPAAWNGGIPPTTLERILERRFKYRGGKKWRSAIRRLDQIAEWYLSEKRRRRSGR